MKIDSSGTASPLMTGGMGRVISSPSRIWGTTPLHLEAFMETGTSEVCVKLSTFGL